MASSNGLIESMCIHGTNSDHQRILEDLKKFETTISHLKCCRPKELSAEIKTKIHLLATSFQALQSRLFRNAAGSKTLEKVWEESDVMLKYLFEKCIQYFEEDDRLKCVTCDEWLPVCRVVLKNHLQCSKHIRLFLKSVHHDLVSYWEDIEPQGGESEKDNHIDDDKCLMLKYGRFIDFDGPNNMLFCKLCCIVLPKNKSSLQAHFKDNLHQEMFKNVVEVIVGNVDVRDAEKMNAVSKSFETKHDRKIEDNYNTDASNSIAIPIGLSGIPENTTNDDLKRVIQHFGSINRIERIHPSFANAFIELREEFQSILCLGLTVTVSGKVVTITDPILPSETDDGANEISIHESVNSQSILMKFRTSSDLWVLIINLIMRSKKVCNYAESIALNLSTDLFSQNAIIPHCFYSVKAVGSKALFLAIDISSTLDLCIEEIYDEYHGKSKINAVELSTRTIKLFDILKKSKHFKNVEIVGDKMQVLKLLHKVTNTKCQIFYKDALIVEKTVLSKIYLDCDPNLRCTVLAVIEWFNGIGLKSVLSTYSILWLALLPLILCNDLHPVSTLRNLHDKTAKNAKKIISGWDCRFSRTFNPKMRQFPNVHEILQKIFKFYSNPCNFDKKVLAPLTGEKFEHQAILENKLPSPYSRYCYLISTKSVKFFKLTNGICLQDPLQLNFNLTESLQGNNLNKFVAHCTDALKYFDDTTYRMTKNESFEHVFKMDPFSTWKI